MIRLITASPGSGKTCLVVEWLCKEIDRGFYKEFYTNIENLKIMGVKKLPADGDWRTLNPNKSKDEPPKLVVIDEAQYFEAFMKENRSANNRIGKDLSTHRHYGIDIWFITQSTKLLNDYVLENVGEHVHLYRPRKKKNIQVYWWSYVQKSLTKSAFKDADDMQVWRLNPAMFELYKSTSNVTDSTARTSHKLVSSLFTAFAILGFIAYMVYQGLGSFTQMKTGKEDKKIEAPEQSTTQSNTPKTDSVLGVSVSSMPKEMTPNQNQIPSQASSSTATLEPVEAYEQAQLNRRYQLYAQDLPDDYTIRRIDPYLQVRGVVKMGNQCKAYNALGDTMTLSKKDCQSYVNTGKVYKSDFNTTQNSDFNAFNATETQNQYPTTTQNPNTPPTPNNAQIDTQFAKIDTAPNASTSEYIHRPASN